MIKLNTEQLGTLIAIVEGHKANMELALNKSWVTKWLSRVGTDNLKQQVKLADEILKILNAEVEML